MIARVSLEIALRKEFDYFIPPELVGAGGRGQPRAGAVRPAQSLGLRDRDGRGIGARETQADPQSHRRANAGHAQGAQARALDRGLLLLRAGDRAEVRAARSRAPEEAGWRERLFVRALPVDGRISQAAQAPAGGLEHHRGAPRIAAGRIARTGRNHRGHGAQAGRSRLDRNRPANFRARSVRARTHSAEPAAGAESGAGGRRWPRSRMAMDSARPREDGGSKMEDGKRQQPSSILHPPSSTFLLHGVTGSGKTEIYLQAIAHALEQGKGAIVLVPEISLTPQTVERFKARFSSGKLQTLVAVLHCICPPANGTTNGTRFGRAARGSSSARARRSLRRSNRSA